MSKDFCMDCGVFLSPYSTICDVCGFDNGFGDYDNYDLGIVDDYLIDLVEEDSPENYQEF